MIYVSVVFHSVLNAPSSSMFYVMVVLHYDLHIRSPLFLQVSIRSIRNGSTSTPSRYYYPYRIDYNRIREGIILPTKLNVTDYFSPRIIQYHSIAFPFSIASSSKIPSFITSIYTSELNVAIIIIIIDNSSIGLGKLLLYLQYHRSYRYQHA